MKFPYMVFSEHVEINPVFKGLTGDPFVLDLSVGSPVFDQVNVLDQKAFQIWLDNEMKGRFSWGLAGYLEDRRTVLSEYPQMKEEERFFHLGLDIIAPLGTKLYAPLDAVVHESSYEAGDGNYGGNVLLRHESPHYETFYSLYGHLKKAELPEQGREFKAGDVFARLGDFHENGNWFYHTHLQIITQKGVDEGWVSKGYCSAKDIADMDKICPSPLLMFKR